MTTIGLIRHGSTAWNKEGRVQGHTDNSLDAEGLQQAQLLAERLSTEQWDYIYSSDLLRARQTAEVIAERLGLEITGLVPGIREMYAGLIEGTTQQERIERWGTDWKTLDLGLETPEASELRGSEVIEEIAARHPGSHILIVSHGAILRSSLRRLLPELDGTVLLNNTSITRITKSESDGSWNCELYNCARHLEKE
ncbi:MULTISPECIES: histidine phosphatase family protein [Paenibacillus]|uniref:Histidine phosphatase family protein n=1 Tax=Paenibacillus odorifer TaxID=189426 RepID=A0A1R0X4D3_9BACL|nr:MULTISPECIES: histidine phosphatase family protein [Paenibacillus]ETT61980.1 phosphoglycerate mutase [Paenibacillus sp. FSL H8-237]MEC0129558.1 histidine phosphatase family protein [Paenibacillus odorifer]MEC0225284.1 histidine phosphatase family protein [Paenibacillus odorifer]OMD28929.1 histidine phosphatase family protein [Paenibacillus odorifer]OME52168.1 histidine phosphatase family protein [Paenibacillus odorifer]